MSKIKICKHPFYRNAISIDVPMLTPDVFRRMKEHPEDIELENKDAHDHIDIATRYADGGYGDHFDAIIKHMEKHGITETASVGPFVIKDFPHIKEYNPDTKEHHFVKIKKGVTIYSTGKERKRESGATRKVKVDHIVNGFIDIGNWRGEVTNIQVNWAGSGGYWNWVSLGDVSF